MRWMKSRRSKYGFLLFLCLPVLLSGRLSATACAQTDLPTDTSGKCVFLSLEACRELSLKEHPAIKNADIDVRLAKAKKQEVLGMYFPKVQLTGLYFRALEPMLEIGITDILGSSPQIRNIQYLLSQYTAQLGFDMKYEALEYGYFGGVSAMQPVFVGGRIVNGNRLAALGVKAARLQKDIQLRTTREEIGQSYWLIVSLEAKRETLLQMKTLLDTVEKDVRSAYKAGLVTENDLMQVVLKKNELRSGMIQLENGIRLAKMNLFNSIGFAYNPYSTVSLDSMPYIDDVFLTDSLADMKDPYSCYVPEEEVLDLQQESQLLDLQVDAQRLQKKLATGESLPQIAVGASYGYSRVLTDGNLNGMVYVMAQIPLSDWGQGARRIQQWNYQIEKAENDREFYRRQLLLQIRKFWMDLTSSWEQLQVAQESVKTAESSVYKLASYYKAGLATLTELLQAQAQWQQAKEQYIDQQIAYKVAMEAYLDRVGTEESHSDAALPQGESLSEPDRID